MNLKKGVISTLALATILSGVSMSNLSTYSFASENNELKDVSNSNELNKSSQDYVLLSKSGDDYIILDTKTNTHIRNVHETENGVTRKLSAYEALDRFNNVEHAEETLSENTSSNEIKNPEVRATQEFQKIGATKKVTGSARSISHDVDGGSKGASISLSKGITTTVGNTFSVSTSIEKKAIQRAADFTWNVSASRSLTTIHNVSPNKIGRVKFKPYYNRVSGKMHTVLASGVISSSKNAHGDSPRKISTGLCDGLEYLEERSR